MKINKILLSFLFGILLVFTFGACNKDKTVAATYPYEVSMTDAPGPYDAVYIDLQGVEITGGNGTAFMLNVHAGIYDLLDFSNGIDTLIASGLLTHAEVSQIRLILGPNNSVVIDSVSYPLSTPSAEQSGLKLQVHQTLEAGVVYHLLLDFDANKSIVETGNGTYKLKPVVRTIVNASSGSIHGKITPIGTQAFVTATSGTSLSYSSNVNANGDFLIMGIPEDTYTFVVTPALPLLPVIQTNILVKTGVSTNVGTIAF